MIFKGAQRVVGHRAMAARSSAMARYVDPNDSWVRVSDWSEIASLIVFRSVGPSEKTARRSPPRRPPRLTLAGCFLSLAFLRGLAFGLSADASESLLVIFHPPPRPRSFDRDRTALLSRECLGASLAAAPTWRSGMRILLRSRSCCGIRGGLSFRQVLVGGGRHNAGSIGVEVTRGFP